MLTSIGLLGLLWFPQQAFFQVHASPASATGDPATVAAVRFTDRAREAGVFFAGGTYMARAADYDQDGHSDLAFSRHSTIALLRNDGEGGFTDLSSSLDVPEGDFHGLAWLDLNQDGWLDLFVTQGAQRGQGGDGNLYYRNNGLGDLRRADLTETLRDADGRGRGAYPWDLDQDGHLDVILTNAQSQRSRWVVADGASGHQRDRAQSLGASAITAGALWAGHLDDDETRYLLTFGNKSETPALYEIGESGRLEAASEDWNLPLDLPFGITDVKVFDFDNDGDQDLYYVASEVRRDDVRKVAGGFQLQFALRESTGRSRVLRFRARGKIKFRLIGARALNRAGIQLGDSGDVIRKRGVVKVTDQRLSTRPDLDFASDEGVYLWRPRPGEIEMIVLGDLAGLYFLGGTVTGVRHDVELLEVEGLPESEIQPCNGLYVNEDSKFIERGVLLGAADCRPGQGATLLDVDNDGFLDLFIANGHEAFGVSDNVLLLNRGGAHFEAVTSPAIRGPDQGRSGNAVAFDYDGDGDEDLFVTHGAGPNPARDKGTTQLLRNDTPGGHWLKVRLLPRQSNTLALGARVEVLANGRRMTRQIGPADFPRAVHFGLGEAESVKLMVRWPSGRVSRLEAGVDRVIRVDEGAAKSP